MSRKIIRNGMRREAEFHGAKASKFVKNEFDRYQIKKVGATVRKLNQAKGTHKRRTWKTRIEASFDAKEIR